MTRLRANIPNTNECGNDVQIIEYNSENLRFANVFLWKSIFSKNL